MTVKLNGKGVSKANGLIQSGKINKGAWSFSAADGNALLGAKPDFAAYGEWFLGVDPSADPNSKARYHYPFGKGGEVYRAALIAIEGRATQQGATDISDAAKRLLTRLDAKKAADDQGFEIKTFNFKLEEAKDASDTGSFSGYASVFGNVDLGGDVIERGAFKDIATTADGQVRVLYQHDMRQPIGKARVSMDDHGLKFDGHLVLGISKSRDAYEAMKAGILDGMSIGYDVKKGGARFNDTTGVRHLSDCKLWEISPVTFGMNQLAGIDSVKTMLLGLRTRADYADWLHEQGFPVNMAKSLATAWREDEATPAEQLLEAGEAVKEMTTRLRALAGFKDDDPGTAIGSVIASLEKLR